MNKLATILGCAMVLTGSLGPLNAASALDTKLITVWDARGDWTGTADVASSEGTYNQVPVMLHISNQDELTTNGSMGTQTYVFVRGTITFEPPFGDGRPMRLAGSLDLKQGNTTMQRGKFTLAGDLFTGELHAMSMTMTDGMNNEVNTLTATGSIVFVGNATKPNPPAVAKLGLTKM